MKWHLFILLMLWKMKKLQEDSCTQSILLVDKEGRIRSRKDDNGNMMGVYDGTSEYEVGLLIDDIKVLMAEYNLAKKEL